jgi:hypothetical protein
LQLLAKFDGDIAVQPYKADGEPGVAGGMLKIASGYGPPCSATTASEEGAWPTTMDWAWSVMQEAWAINGKTAAKLGRILYFSASSYSEHRLGVQQRKPFYLPILARLLLIL